MENPLVFSNASAEVQALRNHAGLLWKPETSSFVLYGEDVRRWCNGMFSNNIRKLQPNHGNRSAICNHKGHVQGLLDIYCLSDKEFLLVLDGISFEAFLERFERYMILDDIEYKNESTGKLVSIQGPNAGQIIADAGLDLPEEGTAILQTEAYTILRKDRLGGGFDILSAQIPSIWEQLKALEKGPFEIGTQAQQIERILQRRAEWPTDGKKISFIHDLRLNEECCAFDKGCYVGQEIINRMDVKGLVNKKLMLFSFSAPIEIGTSLQWNGKAMGTVSSICSFDQKHYGLAIIRKAGWDQVLEYDGGTATPQEPSNH